MQESASQLFASQKPGHFRYPDRAQLVLELEAMLPPLLLSLALSVSMHPLSSPSWWGGTLQVEPAAHQALALSPMYNVSTVTTADAREISGGAAGGELGYFFYTGRPSESGLWAGPSLLARPQAYTNGDQIAHRNALGASLDVGAQLVTKSGLNVNVDYGLQYLPQGLQPRLILTLGWSI